MLIGVLRHADGGSDASYAALVALPLAWLAAYAPMRDVAIAGVVTALTFVVPVAAGISGHPASEWREAAVWGIAMPLAALAGQGFVGRARAQARTLESLTARLRTTEESFRAAFADAPVGQFMCAPTGVLLRVNDALCALTGRSSEDLFGAEVGELVHADARAWLGDLLHEVWVRTEGEPTEYEVRLAEGDRYAQLRLGVVCAEDGRPLYVLGHLVDITARRAATLDQDKQTRATNAVHAATRGISDGVASRQMVCDAATSVARASGAMLMEADRRGSLTATAASGDGVALTSVHIGDQPSEAAIALAGHRSVLVGEAGGAAAAGGQGLGRARSLLYEPVLRDGAAVGVLVVGWEEPVTGVADERVVAAKVLASEAANVLARAETFDSVTRLAHVDPLTGLPNRRAWEERLPSELARARRDGKPLAVALIDLDHFKHHNDEFGHQAGDRMLVEAAAAWRQALRATDLLARYGGEEFAVLLPACDAHAALDLLDRIRQATPDPCTCSIGVAAWDGREDEDTLVGRADRALYAAKAGGRDRTNLSLPRRSKAPGLSEAAAEHVR